MPGYMHQLEVENFKSYKGKQIIGPFKRFTAIIGPNGSGKSNLMDAICFVLGEKISNLRTKKIGEDVKLSYNTDYVSKPGLALIIDLIHGAPNKQAVSSRCHVTMVYRDNEENETRYTRTILHNTSEYRIDGKIVPASYYNEQLENLHIFIKAKNFAVYQGQITNVPDTNPKVRTQLFEQMSRFSVKLQLNKDEIDETTLPN